MASQPKMRQIRKAKVLHATIIATTVYDNTDQFAALSPPLPAPVRWGVVPLTLLHITPDIEGKDITAYPSHKSVPANDSISPMENTECVQTDNQ